jgi:hypothetical protein
MRTEPVGWSIKPLLMKNSVSVDEWGRVCLVLWHGFGTVSILKPVVIPMPVVLTDHKQRLIDSSCTQRM